MLSLLPVLTLDMYLWIKATVLVDLKHCSYSCIWKLN